MIPLLDINAQLKPLRDELLNAITEVMDSTRFIGGPKITELEEKIAEYCGAGYGIGVSSGTDALLVTLMALNVGKDDLVITTPYSFFATAGVISRLHARPELVDIDPDTYNMDSKQLAQWFQDNPGKAGKVKAILPVHLYGQCADMDGILAVANEHSIPVVEDAAQAIGATYPSKDGEKKAGSMGATGCFSFFPSKNLGCMGDGGMVVVSDKALAEKIAKLRNHGASPKYYHAMIGGNFRLDALQAAVLLVKLPHLDVWHKERRKNAAWYDEHFTLDNIKTPVLAYGREHHIFNQYVISVPEKRDELRDHLKKQDIGQEVYYPVPFHIQECFQYLGYRKGDFPCSEYAAEHTLALPIYAELTEEMQGVVVEAVEGFYR